MKILHISDWHGQIWHEVDAEFDIVVSSGDMLPNCSRGDTEKEPSFQRKWVDENLDNWRKLLKGKPFVSCPGNHDYVSLGKILKKRGFDAHEISDWGYEFRGVLFYGFPWVPYIAGEWNYELSSAEMGEKVDELAKVIPHIKVLVCHCPPYGVLDLVGDETYGTYGVKQSNSHLSNKLYYGVDEWFWPRAILTGHFHEANGKCKIGDFEMEVSNASGYWRILEVE